MNRDSIEALRMSRRLACIGIDPHDLIARVVNKDGNRFAIRMDGSREWLCEHGVGHYVDGSVHGCDGCCKDTPWRKK